MFRENIRRIMICDGPVSRYLLLKKLPDLSGQQPVQQVDYKPVQQEDYIPVQGCTVSEEVKKALIKLLDKDEFDCYENLRPNFINISNYKICTFQNTKLVIGSRTFTISKNKGGVTPSVTCANPPSNFISFLRKLLSCWFNVSVPRDQVNTTINSLQRYLNDLVINKFFTILVEAKEPKSVMHYRYVIQYSLKQYLSGKKMDLWWVEKIVNEPLQPNASS